MLLPHRHPPAAATRGDPGLDPLKFRHPAWDREPSLLVEPVLLLRLLQQLPKQRVVEIDDRNQHPPRISIVLAADVDREVSLWDGDRLLHRLPTDGHVPAGAEPTGFGPELSAPS